MTTRNYPVSYLASQLCSAHRWMDRVYAAHIANGYLALGDAYQSAQRRLAVAERRASDCGYLAQELVAWNSDLQAWRLTPAAVAAIAAGE